MEMHLLNTVKWLRSPTTTSAVDTYTEWKYNQTGKSPNYCNYEASCVLQFPKSDVLLHTRLCYYTNEKCTYFYEIHRCVYVVILKILFLVVFKGLQYLTRYHL